MVQHYNIRKRGEQLESIEKKAMFIVEKAVRLMASDIHFIPEQDKAFVEYRINQRLFRQDSISKSICEKIVSHFKFLGGMDIGERRRPQGGSIQVATQGIEVNLRLSTLPSIFQESLVIRILPQTLTSSIATLSLFPQNANHLLSLLENPNGLIIFTGPTGSGKTTTLYSFLVQAVSKMNKRVITLEDPIEKKLPGIVQIQVNQKAGITFHEGFKAILRHDPDIIMVGEIRDKQTAMIAIRAAYTGHLVLTTMHCKNTKDAIYRLKELGIPLFDIEQVLRGIVSQRIVDLHCPYCIKTCTPECRRSWKSRLGIYEILDKTALEGVTRECKGEKVFYHYKSLNDLVNKGIALGYIPERLGDNT